MRRKELPPSRHVAKKWAYYNDSDPFCCAWVRKLIEAGLVAPGVVDERSITEVQPDDLREFRQVHMFCGIAVWSYALRCAGWSDIRNVWTGSCPCQPFSVAGKGEGIEDKRHLWPEFFRLIKECRPTTVIGEQVASPDALAWLDSVQDDLEGAGYAVGAADLCAAGVGAPHIRQRLYWMANSDVSTNKRSEPQSGERTVAARDGESDGLANTGLSERAPGGINANYDGGKNQERENDACRYEPAPRSGSVGRANTNGPGQQRTNTPQPEERECDIIVAGASDSSSGPLGGFWADAIWIPCSDGKARPIESRHESMAPGVAASLGYVRNGDRYTLSPLVKGAKNRIGRLRGYGNCLNLANAVDFVRAVVECCP